MGLTGLMTDTSTTTAPTVVTDRLSKAENRQLLKAAVQAEIFCPFTGGVLDVRRAVLVQISGGRAYVMSAAHWDAVRDSVTSALTNIAQLSGATIDVIDGRELFTASGRAKK